MALITSSKCAMLRGIIALAWADGNVTEDERNQLSRFVDGYKNLSDTQRASLKSYLSNPLDADIDEIWSQITHKEDRAQLIDIALSIFHADADYSATERALYDKLYKNHMASLDVAEIRKDMTQMAAEAKERLKREEEAYLAEIKRSAGFKYVPGVNQVEVLLHRLDKFLG